MSDNSIDLHNQCSHISWLHTCGTVGTFAYCIWLLYACAHKSQHTSHSYVSFALRLLIEEDFQPL